MAATATSVCSPRSVRAFLQLSCAAFCDSLAWLHATCARSTSRPRQGAAQGEWACYVVRACVRTRLSMHRHASGVPKKRPHFEVHFPDAKWPQKCEPQLLRFTLLGPFLCPENGRKIGPAVWPQRGPGRGVPLRAFVSAAGHVIRRVPRATASVCLPFFPCPHGEALVCTPGLVACALHQSPLWHGACVVCTLWWP